jgi:Rps23 Pro-64 3,4-dihydroxylase Tpa1-like proline 4-hydroxylase
MNNQHTSELNTKGFTIIDNFLPLEIATEAFNLFIQEQKWEIIDQVRETHYSHVFKFNNSFYPQEEEKYLAKFSKSSNLAKNKIIQKIQKEYIFPTVQELSPFKISTFNLSCHQQNSGDHFRAHIDDYGASINSIYYVNKDWKWDWGGILNIGSHNNPIKVESIFPLFNRLVLINSKIFRSPHFVTTVEKFAKNPRYSIISFNN